MKQRVFYLEFNPIDYASCGHMLFKVMDICLKEHGYPFEEYNFKVGRVPNNAELHFIKAEIWLPDNHTNNNYLL